MQESDTRAEVATPSGKMRTVTRWIVIVLTGVLICFAILIAQANIHPGGNGHNTAYRRGGAGGLLLIPVIVLLVLKADAVAGIGYVVAAVVIFSAALLLNRAEPETWEPFSWMYVFQSVSAIAIGSPAIRIGWVGIIRPILQRISYSLAGRHRVVARATAFLAYLVAAIGLGFGNYTYYMWDVHHDRSGDRIGFVMWTLIGVALVAGTLKTHWLAIGSCIVAGMGFFMFITYPVWVSVSHFWGQALAIACYVVAFLSSIAIIAVHDEPSRPANREDAAADA